MTRSCKSGLPARLPVMPLTRSHILPRLLGAFLTALPACAPRDVPPRDTALPRDAAPVETGGRVISCSADARPGLEIAVRDAGTGAALGGFTVVLRADSSGERAPLDSGTFPATPGVWRGALEQAGRFAVRVTRPGYAEWDSAGVVVSRDECHVMLRRLDVLLSPAR
jgi:hypothetical protein